jgi:hypothetical protein
MSCTLCTYKITCLTRKLASKILYNHQCRKHRRDSNNNPEEGICDVSDEVIKKKELLDHEEDVPDPADDDPENVPDKMIWGTVRMTPAWRITVMRSG